MTSELIPILITIYIIIFLFGLVIGSFLNVCIYRIPKHETIVTEHSHCMTCGYRLHWYDLVPVVSWLCLRGKCRNCKAKISAQYPIVESLNGIAYVIVFAVNGWEIRSILYCFLFSALLVLSVIDERTQEIPFGINLWILALGAVQVMIDLEHWTTYGIGFLAVSTLLGLILLLSGGRAIGGGDVKLMAAAGLLLGWQRIVLAFFLGCVIGSVLHVARMKLAGAGRALAMGPYLSAGIMISALWGEQMIRAYISLLG